MGFDRNGPKHAVDAVDGAGNEGVNQEDVRPELTCSWDREIAAEPRRKNGSSSHQPAETDYDRVRWIDPSNAPFEIRPHVQLDRRPGRQLAGNREVNARSAQNKEDTDAPSPKLIAETPSRAQKPGSRMEAPRPMGDMTQDNCRRGECPQNVDAGEAARKERRTYSRGEVSIVRVHGGRYYREHEANMSWFSPGTLLPVEPSLGRTGSAGWAQCEVSLSVFLLGEASASGPTSPTPRRAQTRGRAG